MAKLERPKGYSRKLWKKLQNQIRNIKRFVREKTKSGVEIKSAPNTEDVYTKEGRKRIREWSAREQWKQTEYADRETGEILTGNEAKRKWMEDRARQREEGEPNNEKAFDIYAKILEILQQIPNDRVFRVGRDVHYVDTGGLRDQLIDKLNDIDDVNYLIANEAAISKHVETIRFDSEQMNADYAVTELFTIFNKGPLSKEQWDSMQGTSVWNNEGES